MSIHTFPKDICLKANVKARLEFELAHDDSAVQHVDHYTLGDPATFCLVILDLYQNVW